MRAVFAIFRRSLWVPSTLPVVLLTMGATWVATTLGRAGLGATEAYLDEVRHGCMLFAGLLVLSLAEPLQVARDARSGALLLRAARGGGLALPERWLGLWLACVPVVGLAALAGGGAPELPLVLLGELAVFVAGGLMLGSFFGRGRLVPALWLLVLAGYLRPWLQGSAWGRPVAWLLPDLGALAGGRGWWALGCWCAGALLCARWRLLTLCSRGRWPGPVGRA